MAGICFVTEHRHHQQDQWSFVFSNFGITDIWELPMEQGEEIYQPTTKIATAEELPTDRELVVLAPEAGRYYQGTEDLADFDHPFRAIYLFGGSQRNLSEDEMGSRVADHYVYIPFVKYECYSTSAAYITLWDRYVKRGSFG